MIIPNQPRLTEEQYQQILQIVESFSCRLQVIEGAHRTVYAILGDERSETMINRIEGLEFIDRVDTIQSPFKLMDLRSELASHQVKIGETVVGRDFLVMAGHCTIDPRKPELYFRTAEALKEAGVNALRGGVWKPRTNPHSFQGSPEALKILVEARERTGLPVCTEVMDATDLDAILEAGVDVLQIGTRNALNYSLLKAIGRATRGTKTVILLKRSRHMGPIDEFICAAEYLAAEGNPNILLCPRGTLPTLDGYRSHPDESIIPLLKEKTWAPVVVDPSHSVGKATYVPAASLASIAYGADGLILEAHTEPAIGIGDDPKQSVLPSVVAKLVRDAQRIRSIAAEYESES